MNRRKLLKLAAMCAATPFIPAFLTGCNDQTTIAALLAEMETALTAFETDLGKVLPQSVVTAFDAAVNAVKAWVPGTASQDVIQVLQDLSIAVSAFAGITPLTGVEAAAIEIILRTTVNIIELIDPASVPPVATAAQAHLAHAAKPALAQKHFKQGEIPASMLQKQFKAEWLAVTGKAA